MAFDFQSEVNVGILRAGINEIGIYSPLETTYLQNIRVKIYKEGIDDIKSLTLKIGLSEDGETYITSDTINLSEETTGTYWIGWVTFSFSGNEAMIPASDYYFFLETDNYTQTPTNYVAYIMDDPINVGNVASSAAAVNIFGLR